MALEELTLKLWPEGNVDTDPPANEYQIYPLQSVEVDSRKEAFSIAPPGLAAKDNILLGISGMQADITISAFVWDDGTDRSNGTATSAVTTVHDQTTYLEETMHDEGFSAAWKLDHATGSAFNDDDVFVENIAPTLISQDSPKWKPVTFRLRRGGSV